MAQSKIAGKGVFVISKGVSLKIVAVGAELSPPAKKQILLGEAIRRLLADVGNTVFEKFDIYESMPTHPEKSKRLSCLLEVEDADCQIRTAASAESVPMIHCAIAIRVAFKDYVGGGIGSRIIELSGFSSAAHPKAGKKLDSEIEKAVGNSLNDLGRKLAAEIVNAYGARM